MRSKMIAALVAMLMVTGALYAKPMTVKSDVKLEITILCDVSGSPIYTYAESQLKKDFPNVTVKYMRIDLSDGSTMTMDALLAAGRAPNIYSDFIGRVSKYLVPAYALPLDEYIRDLAAYQPGVLDPFRKGGKLYGLPAPGGAQGMCINLDIMDAIGYTVPPNWTIADFLEMAAKVKAKYGDQVWATGMFAANQSGDYLINNWFAAFGAKLYKPGDYTHSTIAETGGARVYAFFQELVRKGYVPPGSAMLNDDDYAAQWAAGKLAATAFFPSWMDGYWKTAIEQGLITKPFRVMYVPFPRDPSVKAVPSYSSFGAAVVHATGTAADVVAARYVEYFNDATAQAFAVQTKVIANRTDVRIESGDPYTAQIKAIVAAGGIMDVGLTGPKFAAVRPQHFPVLQKVLTLEWTPEQAIKEYAARVDAALK